jgi:NADPH-dependent 2,4-dienoyl-CoA reductase/sulfur reductase-like enzyme
MRKIVIIGNGISGVTAARHLRKLGDDKILLISDESDAFFSRTALMYVYMGHMKFEHTYPYEEEFWNQNKIERLRGRVDKIDPTNKTLILADKQTIDFDVLIIATGSIPNRYGWPGEDLQGVQGLYHKQDLETLEASTPKIDRAVIVGGGLIGVELAEMLVSRGKKVTFLVRETAFWNGVLPHEEASIIGDHIKKHGVDLRLSTELKEIISDNNGSVAGVVTHSGEQIPCQWVGLTAGVSPNIGFLTKSAVKTDRGVLVDRHLKTNLPDIYAIGDCAQQRHPIEGRPSVEAVWYTGRIMGETVAQTIMGKPKEYNPGQWFNSAKFFDIEYQTYGRVHTQKQKNEQHLFWSANKKALRIAYDKSSLRMLGIHSLGIRLRHDCIDQWLNEGKAYEYVIRHLQEALFDPELYRSPVQHIQQTFNAQVAV